MRAQKIILCDVDDVLEDLTTSWVHAINKKYGTSVNPEEIVRWNIADFFQDLSRNQVFSPLHTADFWDKLVPIEGSQYYLEKLIEDGHKVLLLTAAHPDTVRYKMKFLSKYFPFISFSDVIITSHKQLVKGDVLIDDAPHNLEGGEYKGILMDAPHNRYYDAENSGFIRVHNWKEIYDTILKLI